MLARAGTDHGGRRPVRPRRLVAAARRGRPRVRLRPGRAAGHADGPDPGITAEEVVNTYPPGDLARVLRVYGEEKFAARIAAAIVRERAKAPITSSARLAELVRDVDPGAGPAHRRAPGQADVPGAADRGQRRAGRAGGGAAGGARRARARRTDRRAVLPLAGGPDRQAGLRRAGPQHRRRSTCRSSCPAPGRRCGCSPGARSCRARPRWRPTRGPLRCGCAPPSGSTRRATTAASEPRQPATDAMHQPSRSRRRRPGRARARGGRRSKGEGR